MKKKDVSCLLYLQKKETEKRFDIFLHINLQDH